MKIIWIANEKQYNILLPLYQQAKKTGIDFQVLAVERISNGFGLDISSEEIQKYLSQKAIESHSFPDPEAANTWLRKESPDFIFTSTPYDIYLPEQLHGERLSEFSVLCYVNYGFPMSDENIAWAKSNPFMKHVSIQFDPTWSKSSASYSIPVGSLKIESLKYVPLPEKETGSHEHPKVGWRPRWTLDKDSTFWMNLDAITSSIRKHNAKLHFFVHPLIFRKLQEAGDKGEKAISILKILEQEGRLKWIPEDTYVEHFSELEVLIADSGSGLPEAAGLNVPVIFTGDFSDLNSTGKNLLSHGLIAQNPEEIITKLDLHLGRGTFPKPTDPFFSPPANQEVSQYVYSILAKYNKAKKFKVIGGIPLFWRYTSKYLQRS